MLVFGPKVFFVGYIRLTQLTLVHKEVICKWRAVTANRDQRPEQFNNNTFGSGNFIMYINVWKA